MSSNPWFRIAATASAVVFVLLLAASWRFLESRGVFTSVETKKPAQCRMVAKLPAISDVAVDDASGTVFVASRSGGLYGFAWGPLVRLGGTPKDFHPVAIALAHNPRTRLQVLFAKADGRHAIAVFDLRPDGLSEVGRLSTDVLTDPAALAALDTDRFYLVNRHHSRTALGRWLDDVFLLPRADVLYFDAMKFVTVAGRLNSPAGIGLSSDKKHLYVSEDYPRSLVTFTRDDFTGGVENPTVMPIESGLGKIHVAEDGSVIIAARPKPGTGQVWRVKDGNAELVYARKDGEIAAAAQLGRHLLVGATDGLTDCFF